ncbi:hypothetical protein OQX61_07375 [Pedobacter sp. PLR]|uniref:TlpA family protein disulfide reductase n=1 Tax=Pedobacter sp. PLR TaxID=2994465 RepID=UPI0022485405|nr:hypothetical protein [Pedobacter sp. PLR]MCX2451090.1 hypothetical protein [Pedobacter sp. PLR]
MKKLLYLLLFTTCISQSSCTMIIKSMGKSLVKKYDDHTDMNVSSFQVMDNKGKVHSFSEIYTGKTVYLYTWENTKNGPPHDKNYDDLKARFASYPDVVFADLYIGSDEKSWLDFVKKHSATNSLFLVKDAVSSPFLTALEGSTVVPFIIGKDGEILSFKGPKPQDKILVDYILFQTRNGVDGTASGKKLIKGVNSAQKFKTEELNDWYKKHFKVNEIKDLSFGISSTQ